MIGIYKFTNKYNRKTYIGQAVNITRRYKSHKNAVINSTDNTYFHNALKKYGIEGFDFEVLIECPRENLNYWEQFYIRYYCSNNPQFGYNMTDGGNFGHLNNEVLKRIGNSLKGKTPWNKGLTKETDSRVKAYGEKQKGKFISEETKNKQSFAHQGKPSGFKGMHKVWDDETHTSFHYEK